MATVTCVTLPMGPACVNLTGVRAGDRNEFTLTVYANSRPMDLTGMEATAQARATAVDTDPALDAVCTIDNPTGGLIKIRWPGEELRTLMDGEDTWEGVWDLQVGDPSHDPVTIAAGSFAAEMDVTR